MNTHPDVLLHVLVAAQEAVLGLCVEGDGLAHGDGAATDHGVEELGLPAQGRALVGHVDAVRVLGARVPEPQTGPVGLRHFGGLPDSERQSSSY